MRSPRARRRRSTSTRWWKRAPLRFTCRTSCSDPGTRPKPMRCLHLAPTEHMGIVDDPGLDGTTERHKIALTVGSCDRQGSAIQALDREPGLRGLIIEMYRGWAGRDRLHIARAALRRDRRVWVYWPQEQAIECVDRERLASLWRHWLFITVCRHGMAITAAGSN